MADIVLSENAKRQLSSFMRSVRTFMDGIEVYNANWDLIFQVSKSSLYIESDLFDAVQNDGYSEEILTFSFSDDSYSDGNLSIDVNITAERIEIVEWNEGKCYKVEKVIDEYRANEPPGE
jgi:hypothetical protein